MLLLENGAMRPRARSSQFLSFHIKYTELAFEKQDNKLESICPSEMADKQTSIFTTERLLYDLLFCFFSAGRD